MISNATLLSVLCAFLLLLPGVQSRAIHPIIKCVVMPPGTRCFRKHGPQFGYRTRSIAQFHKSAFWPPSSTQKKCVHVCVCGFRIVFCAFQSVCICVWVCLLFFPPYVCVYLSYFSRSYRTLNWQDIWIKDTHKPACPGATPQKKKHLHQQRASSQRVPPPISYFSIHK